MNVFIACSASEKIENHYYEEMKNVCDMLCDAGYDLLFSPYNKGMLAVCYELSNINQALNLCQTLIAKLKIQVLTD